MDTIIKFLNGWGGSFQSWASSSLLQTGILFFALALVDLLARKRARATVRYAVWMLMLLKLALPVDFSLPTGLVRLETQPVRLVETALTMGNPVALNDFTAGKAAVGGVAAADRNDSKRVSVTVETMTWRGALFGIWAVGCLVGSGVVVARSLALRRLVRRAAIAPEAVEEALRTSAKSMGVGAKISARITEEMQTPALAGLFRPVILLPPSVVAALSARELRAVLAHELSHVRRLDVAVNCVQTVLQIVHFFNPFVWLANARIRGLREEAVDEMVLVSLGEASDVYPETLVRVARLTISSTKFFPGAIGIMEMESGVSARVKRILTGPLPKTARMGVRGAVAILCLGAALLPMARGQKEKELTAPTPRVRSLKETSIEHLFDRYKIEQESIQRDQAMVVAEILQRDDVYEFLSAKLKKIPGKPPILLESRCKAAHLLGRLGERAQSVVPVLIAALEDEESLRFAATASLGMIGPAAKAAIPALIDELNFQNTGAVSALMRIAPQSDEVLKALIDALLDKKKDADVREQILMVFQQAKPKSQRMDDGLKAIVEGNEAEQLKREARLLLGGKASSAPQTQERKYTISDLPQLLKQIRDNRANFEAIDALASLGSEAAPQAVPLLIEMIENKKPLPGPATMEPFESMRMFKYLGALGSFGTNALPALPLLMKYAKSQIMPEAQHSLMSIGRIGPAAIEAKPLLLSSLNDPDPMLRIRGANSLWQVDHSEVNRVLPILINALNSGGQPSFRLYAATFLGEIGAPAKEAIPDLKAMLKDENSAVVKTATEAIRKIENNL